MAWSVSSILLRYNKSRREISDTVAKKLGYTKISIFVEVKGDKEEIKQGQIFEVIAEDFHTTNQMNLNILTEFTCREVLSLKFAMPTHGI